MVQSDSAVSICSALLNRLFTKILLDQGLVELIQSNSAVLALCPEGGFMTNLPENFTNYPSWTWRTISSTFDTGLLFTKGLIMRRWQIDVYGSAAAMGADCIALAAAIDNVLNGFSGTLSDPDSTWVNVIDPSDLEDFPLDPASRTYRRMLEYEIHFANS
jgi:hypothetical protein